LHDIPFIEKMNEMYNWKTSFLQRYNLEFLMEVMEFQLDFQKVMNEFVRVIQRAQKRGEIRSGIQPKFIIAMIEKMSELAKDQNLMADYPDVMSFWREAVDFFLFGISQKPEAGK